MKIHNELKLEYFLEELDKDKNFLESINESIQKNKIFKKRKFNSIYEFSVYRNFIYSLIRNKNPKIIVETGVLHGLTSAWILKALKDNGGGKLISIDLPRREWKDHFGDKPFGPGGDAEFELDKQNPGWVIPEDLLKLWELHLGPSSQFLEKIILENKNIDLFIHDSDHSYEVMKFECDLIQKKTDNIDIVIDDHYCNNYYNDFSRTYKREYVLIDDINDSLEQVDGSAFFPSKK